MIALFISATWHSTHGDGDLVIFPVHLSGTHCRVTSSLRELKVFAILQTTPETGLNTRSFGLIN